MEGAIQEPFGGARRSPARLGRGPDESSRIEKALTSYRWVFAKTMPDNPHWYTLRREWRDDDLFDEVVTYIRTHGVNERYEGRDYTVLFLEGHKYWTMGWPVEQTILINRKPVDDPVNKRSFPEP